MQGQIRPNPTTPPLLGTLSSGPDVNPPSSDLTPQSRSQVAIASAAPTSATVYGLSSDTRESGRVSTSFLTESGGEWSVAQYIRAVETEDENLRRETMDSIRRYNREDLEATWAVMQWLKRLAAICIGAGQEHQSTREESL